MESNQIKESIRDAYEKIEELQFQLHIDAIPLTEMIVKCAVENFIDAAHLIENAPLSAFYDKDIEHFNMLMWRIRDHALDIMNSWLRRHNNEVGQDDPVCKSCVSIIKAIRMAAIETGTPIQPRPDDNKGLPRTTNIIKVKQQHTNSKRGRPAKKFENYFIVPEDEKIIMPILEDMLKNKVGEDAARIIVACCKEGWMSEPSSKSIDDRFGISQKGLSYYFNCHFRQEEMKKKEDNPHPPFTDEELLKIIDSIKKRIDDKFKK